MRELVLAVAGKDKPQVIHYDRLLKAKTKSGPCKAAFLAAYSSGWVAYPLPTGFPVTVNGARLQTPTPLTAGDQLTLGDLALEVTSQTPADDPPEKWVRPACTVTAVVDGQTFTKDYTRSPVLIGSSRACNMMLPTPAEPLHALLAYHENRWHIHALAERGLCGLDGQLTPSAVAVSGAAVWIGSIELSLTCPPFDLIGAADAPAEAAPAQAARPTPSTAVETAAVPKPKSRPQSFSHLDGYDLCEWVKHQMAALHFDGRREDVPPADSRDVLAYYKAQLARNPGDLRLLRGLADRFAQAGFFDLQWAVLQETLRYHPKDAVTLVRLADRAVRSAENPSRGPDERAAELGRAVRYATRAADADPNADGLAEVRARLASAAVVTPVPPKPR